MDLHLRIELLLGLSLVLSFFDWGRRILFPIQIFTTWVHECWHAGTALLLGGDSIRITLAADGSGLTHYKIPKGRIRQGIIASAGYLGTSISGCLLFALCVGTEKFPVHWNISSLVILLCTLIGLSLLVWIRNAFGFISVLLLGAALASLHYAPMTRYASEILLFLSIQTALNALFDIRTLFSLGSSKANASDAHTMARLFFLPAWFWAISWMAISIFLMYWTTIHVW